MQKTNLNVSPYFDDFNEDKNFNRVLFKPGTPIQTRELTTLQSILQNQIDKFGQHFFKEGQKVIPAQIFYDQQYECILVDKTYLGVDVDLYADKLIGSVITGQTSNVVAKVVKFLKYSDSELNSNTFYIKYIQPGNSTTGKFFDGETLITSTDIIYSTGQIETNNPFANTISSGASKIGSTLSISEGVYFLRGHFVKIFNESLILEQYSNKPTYKVGFNVKEELINSFDDSSLNDNSTGSSNFSAPGADRLKISATLTKKELNDESDPNFVEILRIIGGSIQESPKLDPNSEIRKELARRTYDESGDYIVDEFKIFPQECLNDSVGNGGFYEDNFVTAGGNLASEDLFVLNISPGKAYVRGFEVAKNTNTIIDIDKPRTTKTVDEYYLQYQTGNLVILNNAYGSPAIGIGTTNVVSLRDSRVGSDSSSAAGNEIGQARVYDYFLNKSGIGVKDTRYSVSLFDIQTYTTLTISSNATIAKPALIEGNSSGSKGYLKSDVSNSNTLNLYEVNGQFIAGETISINGIVSQYAISSVKDYDFSDIKSLYNSVGINTFSADLDLLNEYDIVSAKTPLTVSAKSGQNSTVTIGITSSLSKSFILKVGDIVKYTRTGFSTITYNKVTDIASDLKSFTVTGVSTVANICDGAVPDTQVTTTDLVIIRPGLSNAVDSGFIESLPKLGISDVEFDNSDFRTRKEFPIAISGSTGSIGPVGENLVFDDFDDQKFLLTYSDGSIESLSIDQLSYSGDKKTLTFNFLSKATDANAKVIATLIKSNITSKKKILNRCNTITIDKSSKSGSGTGGTTLNDGLTYSTVYGTRVQDREISLNVPEVLRVRGIFQSKTTSDPILPKLTLSLITPNTLLQAIQGDQFIGKVTKAVGRVVSTTSDTVTFVYENENGKTFQLNEEITFKKSGITATIFAVTLSDKNILSDFIFDDGQREEFLDYSRIIRNQDSQEPIRKLTIVYDNYTIDSNDSSDLCTIDSYDNEYYNKDIPFVFGNYLTNSIDHRPRVSPYSGSLSPFEFGSRNFSTSGSNPPNTVVGGQSLKIGYSFYLPRIDKVLLTPDGDIIVRNGEPAESPVPPAYTDISLDLATLSLSPYVYNASKEVFVELAKHKLYRMQDIGKLEKRITNLEYYTELSLLEQETSNLTIKDPTTGLDKFKLGFFVDNFTSFNASNVLSPDFKSSIDTKKGELRPSHYTTAIDLFATTNTTDDPKFLTFSDPNIQPIAGGELVTLKYDEIEFISQTTATRTENINPFNIITWSGVLKFTPEQDNFVTTTEAIGETIEMGDYAEKQKQLQIDPNTGLGPQVWNSWVEDWTGTDVPATESLGKTLVESKLVSKETKATKNLVATVQTEVKKTTGKGKNKKVTYVAGKPVKIYQNQLNSTFDNTYVETFKQYGKKYQTGIQQKLTSFTESKTYKTQESKLALYCKSRNVHFVGKMLKPKTQHYIFINEKDMTGYYFPKLLQISMISGTFQVGEYVTDDAKTIKFRVAKANHKEGKFNGETENDVVATTFKYNPYEAANVELPAEYSTTSTILNVDTIELSSQKSDEQADGTYGSVSKGMKLISDSGAQATISEVKLVTDINGILIGSIFIPPTNTDIKIPTGEVSIKLTSSSNNNPTPEENPSVGDGKFYSTGTEVINKTNTINIKNGIIETIPIKDGGTLIDKTFQKTTSEEEVQTIALKTSATGGKGSLVAPNQNISISGVTLTSGQKANVQLAQIKKAAASKLKNSKGIYGGKIKVNSKWVDPLAQSIMVPEEYTNGVFVTSIDIFFKTKPSGSESGQATVLLEIRTMNNGLPSSEILTDSVVVLEPENVNVSTTDPNVKTNFKFKNPIYLEPNKEYAVVLRSSSDSYNVWISKMGEQLIGEEGVAGTGNKKPYMGVLFKSQNASTWDPSQFEDLKFVLYRAKFATGSGTFQVYNPQLNIGNGQIANLKNNPILTLSNEVKVGLGSTVPTENLTNGVTITQINNTTATGKLSKYGGAIGIGSTTGASSNLVLYTTGIGLTPTSGAITYSGLALTSITGSGSGGIVQLQVNSGAVGVITVTNGGSGYTVGDIVSTNVGGTNSQVKFTVGVVTSVNYVELTGVQGTFNTVDQIAFINNVGVASTLPATPSSVTNDPGKDGLHVKVRHKNHGMHSRNNFVQILSVYGDDPTTLLSSEYSNTATTSVQINSATNFATFEGQTVSATNPGYVRIDNEIIGYTGVDTVSTPNLLTGITRGIDSTVAATHLINSIVHKYEINGVSLRRVNTTHSFADADADTELTLDEYYLKVDMSSAKGTNRTGSGTLPALKFTESQDLGGNNVFASQNMPFETLFPHANIQTPPTTYISTRIRTISGTSASGNEISFLDQGFEDITLNQTNYLTSQRIICSQINETNRLSALGLPSNKSFTMEFNLFNFSDQVSPVINLESISVITTSNRIDKRVTNYATDKRVSLPVGDPNAAVYVSKKVTLEEPATSIQVRFDANRDITNDIRVLYRLFRDDAPDVDQPYILFPGYKNIDINQKTINPSNSDGTPDVLTPPNNGEEFTAYKFSESNLVPFNGFMIKIIMTGTNQAKVPRISNLQALALA